MLNKTLPLLLCLTVSGLAMAQTTDCRTNDPQRQDKILGKTVDVKGLVTVSNGTQLAGVANGNPVTNGTRYITSSTGFVTLQFERCEVKLKPNEAVTVDECRICDGMIAAITPLTGVGVGAGVGPGIGLGLVGIAVVDGGGGAVLLGGGGQTPGGGGQTPGGGGQTPDNPPLSNQ